MQNQTPEIIHKNEFFTVVIPVYNREKLVLRSLDSVKRQTYRPLRVIVVDNNSTDATLQALKKWKEENESEEFVVDILSEPEKGAARARNRGLREVDTEHMAFFDSDDVMAPDLVTTVMHEFNKDPKLQLFFWRCAWVNDKEEVIPRRFSRHNPARCHIFNSMLSTQSYATRTAFMKSCGGWNNSLDGWDDWELGVRLLLNGPKMKGSYRVLSYIYPQDESITGTAMSLKPGVWERALDATDALAEGKDSKVAAWLHRMIIYRRVNLAALYTLEGHPELGKPLLEKTLADPSLSTFRKRLLRLIFTYTSNGGRGAYVIWR